MDDHWLRFPHKIELKIKDFKIINLEFIKFISDHCSKLFALIYLCEPMLVIEISRLQPRQCRCINRCNNERALQDTIATISVEDKSWSQSIKIIFALIYHNWVKQCIYGVISASIGASIGELCIDRYVKGSRLDIEICVESMVVTQMAFGLH